SAIGHAWRVATGRQLSKRTIYRTIRTYGLLSCRPRLVLSLTNRYRQLQLTRCQKRALWNEVWDYIIFSDEPRRGERRQLQFRVDRETALTRGVMAW
ncbi:unnamed protein product, partial [Callosobruchus maculatus]